MKIKHLIFLGISSVFLAGCTLPFQQQTISLPPEVEVTPQPTEVPIASPGIERLADKNGQPKRAGLFIDANGQEVGTVTITTIQDEQKKTQGYYLVAALQPELFTTTQELSGWLVDTQTGATQKIGKFEVKSNLLAIVKYSSDDLTEFAQFVVAPSESVQPVADAVLSTNFTQL